MSEGLPPSGEHPPGWPGPWPGDGLGTSSSDVPTFRTSEPPSATRPPGPFTAEPPRAPSLVPRVPAPPARPEQSRLPAVLTAAAVVLVVAVVAVGTAMARYADTHLPAAPPPARPAAPSIAASPLPTPVPGSIEFRTRRGAGRLVVLSHTWVPGTAPAGPSDTQLRIRLELVCTEGRVDYAPEYFSLFDTDGHLVELSGRTMGPGPLAFGSLGPGERVRGAVAFDVPRGDVTLVMGDDISSVTAIRVTA
jgi:hypothetical protein